MKTDIAFELQRLTESKKMNKQINRALFLFLTIALSGCGQDSDATNSASISSNSDATESTSSVTTPINTGSVDTITSADQDIELPILIETEETQATISITTVIEDTDTTLISLPESFSLIDMQPLSITGNNAAVSFTWNISAFDESLTVNYAVCQKESDQENDCLILGSTTNSASLTVPIGGSLQAMVSEYFILASVDSEVVLSNEKVFDDEDIDHFINVFKASNAETVDVLGRTLAFSADGTTLAVGAPEEDSSATGINGDETDNSASSAGAVYLFRFDGNSWSQQAYIKASNTGVSDLFGDAVSLSADGNTLAVGAYSEDADTTGINGTQNNNASAAGAVYLYQFSDNSWSQQAYIKASNAEAYDLFGRSVSLSEDGTTLAVGASSEASTSKGINGDETNNSGSQKGAVYLFRFDGTDWVQQAYIKAAKPWRTTQFGKHVYLNGDGNTLAVGSNNNSNATGINGSETNNNAANSGAVYLFRYSDDSWSQQAFIKASNTEASDIFSHSTGLNIALSSDGDTLAVGAYAEDSAATGIGGDQSDNSASSAGAVYLYRFDGSDWAQQRYIKASNSEAEDQFGYSVSLSSDGTTLAVGANQESSAATGMHGEQSDNNSDSAGAVYLYRFTDGDWSQFAYIKASNTVTMADFGNNVALNEDGSQLAVSANYDSSDAIGINGEQTDNSGSASGAVYLY